MEISESGENIQTSRDFGKYLPLYNTALTNDWETANTLFFQKNKDEIEATITLEDETALHVAVQSGKANGFVRNLVELMSPEAIALRDSYGYTALHEVARVGNTEAAIAMLEKNPDLVYMLCDGDLLPVSMAAMSCQKEILEYLISVCKPNMENNPFEGQLGVVLLIKTIGSKFFDVALDLVDKYPHLARLRATKYGGRCALSFMAEMESVFPSRQRLSWWEKLIYRCVPLKQDELGSTFVSGDIEDQKYRRIAVPRVKDIKDKKETHKKAIRLVKYLCREKKFLPEKDAWNMLQDSIFRAAEHGISEIVQLIMEMYPVMTASADGDGMSIMHVAASNRFENVFNITYNMSDRKHLFSSFEDSEGNNLLNLCARLAPPDRLNLVPGAALQMQRELQWFIEIQRFVPPSRTTWINKDGKTPKMLFTEEHLELKAQGEKWMKDTANACSIATALIATVVFAAAFTVPGGVSSETGIPTYSEKPAFVLFATANAVSLFSSITSLMMFLSILTSRYAEEDFLHVLPKRLSFGLLSLFISVTFMLIAFSAALYLVFHKNRAWFILPVAAFGWLPFASFVFLQFPLLVDVVYSTYGPGIFGKKTDHLFY